MDCCGSSPPLSLKTSMCVFSQLENCFIMQCIDLGLFVQRQMLKNYKFDFHLQFSALKNCSAVMIEELVFYIGVTTE